MDLFGLACAVLAGLINSSTPLLFQLQGAAKERQLGMQLGAHLFAGVAAAGVVVGGGLLIGGFHFWLAAIGTGAAFTLVSLTYFSVVLHRGPVAISWAVVWLNVVGVAVLGWVILREPIQPAQPFGLVSFVACLAAMAMASHRPAERGAGAAPILKGYWLWLLVALAAGTAGNFLMKFKDQAPVVGHDVTFIAGRFLVGMILLPLFGLSRRILPTADRRTLLLSAGYGGAMLANLWLMLTALRFTPVSVFFPVTAGAAIFFGVLWALLRGERPSPLAYAGALLAVAAIVLINL